MRMCCCNYHWPKTKPSVTGRWWTRLLWRWHYPGKSVSIRLEQISRSPTCLEFSPTAKEHLPLHKMDCRLIGCFEKRTLPEFPKPSSLHLQTNTVTFSSTHMKCSFEENRLSHLASPWILILMSLTCKSTTWKFPSKAKRANRLRRPR